MASGQTDVWGPVLLSALAGSATGVGGLLVYVMGDVPSDRTIAFALAYAAGVMMCVSLFDLYLPMATRSAAGFLTSTACAGAGALLCRALARLKLPEPDDLLAVLTGIGLGGGGSAVGAGGSASVRKAAGNSGVGADEEDGGVSPTAAAGSASLYRDSGSHLSGGSSGSSSCGGVGGGAAASAALGFAADGGASAGAGVGLTASGSSAWRVGMLLALILTAHNLPEGLAVAAGATKSDELGLALCAAIFAHNLAEGAVIAIPLLRGLPDRRVAVGIAALTGLSEPVGALLGVTVLSRLVSPSAMGAAVDAALTCVAGIMADVSLRELLPLAGRHAAVASGAAGGDATAPGKPPPGASGFGGVTGDRLVAYGLAAGAASIGATLLFV
jgi:zinc transporter ZupT